MVMSSAIEIAKDLQRRVASGELAPGQALPTRAALVKRYQVARATIDRAIDVLVRSEVVEARQGAGTWVREVLPGARIAVIGSPLPAYDLLATNERIRSFSYQQMATASDRRVLRGFDGLLWNRPEAEALTWAADLAGSVPQVLINRAEPEFACVSTDHRTPYRQITGERLDRLPEARAYFLRRADLPLRVTRYRENGFVDACRERQRFHEQIAMPGSFAASLAVLEAALHPDQAHPLIIVSDSLMHTGALMAWARTHGLRWQQDLWYSDFDNVYPADVWGVTVTSFVQREAEVHAAALTRLSELIARPDQAAEHTLVQPQRRDGST
jgi:DNA-binding LacI/PurR family transcriptional regulator